MNFYSLFGAAIAEERKRLALSQAKAATACGVSREMWGKYERDQAVMGTEVLARFAAAGADVLYILTGQRNASMPALQPDEAVLLSSYRHCTPAAKQNLIQTAALLAAGIEPEGKKQKKKPAGIKVSGSNNRVAGKNYQE